MAQFFFLLLSALAWVGLNNELSGVTVLQGLLLGALLWYLFRMRSSMPLRPLQPLRVLKLVVLSLALLATFAVEIVLANWRQLRIVLAPRVEVRPFWVNYRTLLQTPGMRAVLGMMIVLTPGTVAYGEYQGDDGQWRIGIHGLHARDEADMRATLERIRRRLERRLLQMERL